MVFKEITANRNLEWSRRAWRKNSVSEPLQGESGWACDHVTKRQVVFLGLAIPRYPSQSQISQSSYTRIGTLSKKRRSRRSGAQQRNSHSYGIEASRILIVWRCFFLTASCCLSYLSYWESKKLSLNFTEMTSILQRKLNLYKAYESKIHYSQRQNPWSDAKMRPNPLSTHHL